MILCNLGKKEFVAKPLRIRKQKKGEILLFTLPGASASQLRDFKKRLKKELAKESPLIVTNIKEIIIGNKKKWKSNVRNTKPNRRS